MTSRRHLNCEGAPRKLSSNYMCASSITRARRPPNVHHRSQRRGIGRFANAARVDGFGTGVNVLAAGNEVGKSTLFKAIRTCLFSRHDSQIQEIRDLGSDDSQLPATVQLAFEHGGRRYMIKKSFLRSPAALLTEDGREIARFAEADKAIWDILGIGPGSGRSIDDGGFGLLWVGQGAS